MTYHNWFGKQYIILLDHGIHFMNYHPILFYNKLIEIKEAASEYKRHSPDSLIVFKTSHYIRGNFKALPSVTSGLVGLWQRELIFKVFGSPYAHDLKDDRKHPVKVWDVFSPSFVAFDRLETGKVFPSEEMLKESTHMLFNLMRHVGYH